MQMKSYYKRSIDNYYEVSCDDWRISQIFELVADIIEHGLRWMHSNGYEIHTSVVDMIGKSRGKILVELPDKNKKIWFILKYGDVTPVSKVIVHRDYVQQLGLIR